MKKLVLVLSAILLLGGTAGAYTLQLNNTWDIVYGIPYPTGNPTAIYPDLYLNGEKYFSSDGTTRATWDWTSASPVRFDITDLYVIGDEFTVYNVYDSGSLVFSTPPVPDWNTYGSDPFPSDTAFDPETAWNDSRYSQARWVFNPGTHSITIRVSEFPSTFDDSQVAFRASVVPLPGALLFLGTGLVCYAGLRKRLKKL